MIFRIVTTAILLFSVVLQLYSQNSASLPKHVSVDSVVENRFSVSTTWLSFANFGAEKTNTHHYEFHFKYALSSNDKIGIKVATWRLFAPMGMPMSEQLKFDELNFYPGKLRENGIGITYQRILWKGVFATLEMMPQLKTYFDEDLKKMGTGFKLYTSYHVGYHLSLFKSRLFVEPQIHCQYWPIDTNTPQSFKEKESPWNNYFLFEPNLYIGFNF